MRSVLLVVAALGVGGCPAPTDPITPDGGPPSDGTNDDAPPNASRLIISWATSPMVPGVTTGGNTVTDVKFRMENFKATVDVDPTDPNTTKEEYKLHWDDDDTPASITFENAPAGTYTSVVLQLDEGDDEEAFEITGTAANSESYKLDDRASMSISMNCNVTLAAGEERTLVVDINLQPAIDTLDIQTLNSGDGFAHHLDANDDPEAMATFRTALQQAFSIRTN